MWLRKYLGSRRSAMLAIALFSAFLGATLYHDAGLQVRGQSILFLGLPVWMRVIGWTGTALIAIVVAFFGPPAREKVGWFALALMPFERVFSYLVSFIVWVLPGGQGGTPWGIAYAAQWSCMILLIAITASWREDSSHRLWMTQHNEPPKELR